MVYRREAVGRAPLYRTDFAVPPPPPRFDHNCSKIAVIVPCYLNQMNRFLFLSSLVIILLDGTLERKSHADTKG